MTDPLPQDIQELLMWVTGSSAPPFYRDHWRGEKTFEALPPVSRADFLATPLSLRRYKDEKALVKVVHAGGGLFSSEWSFADIARESWGPLGIRPLVYLADSDEMLEKTMWCYEQNVLPLIGEVVPEITNSSADFYRIDSLVTDAASLQKLLPHLGRRTEPLESIAVLGGSFDCAALLAYARYAKRIQLVLSLPETGAFAQAPLSADPAFALLPGCYLEKGEQGFLLTKAAQLVTPIIRYALPRLGGVRFA